MNSPLGKYSQVVAAGIAVAIIGAYILALLFGRALDVEQQAIDRLSTLALIAIGAVFGSAATLNGVKAPLESAHQRIDKLETGTGIQTHGSYPIEPPRDTLAELEHRIDHPPAEVARAGRRPPA